MCVGSQPAVQLKPRRVIFPTLHAIDCSSPVDVALSCISDGPMEKDILPKARNLTLEDIALMHADNFKRRHTSSLGALISRDKLITLGLDMPSRLGALPLTGCLNKTTKFKKRLHPVLRRARVESMMDSTNEVVKAPARSVRVFSARPTQSTSSSSGGRRSILPIRVSPLRRLSSSVGLDSFSSDGTSIQSDNISDVTPKKGTMQLVSILRKSSYRSSAEVEKVSSVESDIPSLAPSDTSSDEQSPVSENKRYKERYSSLSEVKSGESKSIHTAATPKGIVFDARVLVREFTRSDEETDNMWYTADEMNKFKLEATRRILAFTRTEIIPTGTGRMIERVVTPTSKALFSHAALQIDSVEDVCNAACCDDDRSTPRPGDTIHKILIVDPYDICLQLFTRAFQQAIPGVVISTSRTSEEALKQVQKTSFDLVVVEERLKLFHRQHCDTNASGSMLLRRVAEITQNQTLLVGVSAHLPEDAHCLQEVGQVDLLWSKPPPPLTSKLLTQLDTLLKSKRECGNNDRS